MWNLLIPVIGQVLDKVLPDQKASDEAKIKLLELAQKGELAQLELVKSQLDVNKEEAKSESLFKSGWRPGIGWICGIAFSYNFVIGPLVAQFYPEFIYRALDMTELMPVLLGMLGLGGLRTYEKSKGVN